VLGVLLTMFLLWGPGFQDRAPVGGEPKGLAVAQQSSVMTAAPARYAPHDVAVARGTSTGDMSVTWRMPIRPDVVATVVYEDAGTIRARARAVVSYNGAGGVPRVTLHGLPRRQRVCLSVAHVVSVNDRVTHAISQQVCAVPR
jgi:hypothetical protein